MSGYYSDVICQPSVGESPLSRGSRHILWWSSLYRSCLQQPRNCHCWRRWQNKSLQSWPERCSKNYRYVKYLFKLVVWRGLFGFQLIITKQKKLVENWFQYSRLNVFLPDYSYITPEFRYLEHISDIFLYSSRYL